ncbi:MAG: tetratricopeptide repeat protein [Saprospiraceae bacterium]|nr:tetratricopeptide repeat protein [Saprospiraceae bacterium]
MKSLYLWSLCILLFSCSGKYTSGTDFSDLKRAINLCTPAKEGLATLPGNDGSLVPLFDGIDVYDYPITTKSKIAQMYFNQGLVLAYGFNYAEAARSFREAIRRDPECAMCHWGLAYSLGPTYNWPMDMDVLSTARDALYQAQLNMHSATAKEQAVIKAMVPRLPKEKVDDMQPYNEAYAESILEVHHEYPDDVDLTVMAAEALMILHPWDIWKPDRTSYEWTAQIIEVLERALSMDEHHPFATHMYIHAMEAGPDPERAEYAADNLALRVPGEAHLLHMPSHLYINIGEYRKGALANIRSIKMDSAYHVACEAAGVYALGARPHNWHFLAACLGLEGNTGALEVSRFMVENIVDLEDGQDRAGMLQHFMTIPWHIQVQFAMWDDILEEPLPLQGMPVITSTWHYARAMAHASLGESKAAQSELERLMALLPEVDSLKTYMNSIGDLMRIASSTVRGQIALNQGDFARAIAAFEDAIEIEDQLKYIEPPDWFFSVRHRLGDVLLQAGMYDGAESVYRKDLERYKKNGWALNGLRIALEKQGRMDEARETQRAFEDAWAHANVMPSTSVM